MIDDTTRTLLRRAKDTLLAQVAAVPPYDAPWSFFDLAELHLYDGSLEQFKTFAGHGVSHAIQHLEELLTTELQGLLAGHPR